MDELYGLEDDETLQLSLEDVIDHALDSCYYKAGEPFDVAADRIEWPLKVFTYRRVDLTKEIDRMANFVLNELIYRLDETYADPDSDKETQPNQQMKEAATQFVRTIIENYTPWLCEKTGEVTEVTREMARKIDFDIYGDEK